MKVKPSIAFEDMRGSAGGVTASKNKSRLYVKNRISPRNPRTTKQMNVRGNLTSNAKDWAALTQAQREMWIEAAKNVYGKRQLGSAAKISGFNLFVRLNNNLALIGNNRVDEPRLGTQFPVFEVTGTTLNSNEDGVVTAAAINVTGLTDISAMNLIIRATPVFSVGRASYPSLLSIINTNGVVANNAINVVDYVKSVLVESSSKFVGKIQFEIYLIDANSGEMSLKQNTVMNLADVVQAPAA